MLVRRSNAAVAEHFIAQVLKRENIAPVKRSFTPIAVRR